MCGIVGYIGNKPAYDTLINGLKKLEYRGYDSSGIMIYKEKKLVKKQKIFFYLIKSIVINLFILMKNIKIKKNLRLMQ
mgnify:CR=1 FL=1